MAPGNAGFRSNLAIAYQKVGQLDRAHSLLMSVISNTPNNVQAICSLGNVLLEKGDNEEAYTQFELADKLSPGSFAILSSMAEALRRLEMNDAALDRFKARQ